MEVIYVVQNQSFCSFEKEYLTKIFICTNVLNVWGDYLYKCEIIEKKHVIFYIFIDVNVWHLTLHYI